MDQPYHSRLRAASQDCVGCSGLRGRTSTGELPGRNDAAPEMMRRPIYSVMSGPTLAPMGAQALTEEQDVIVGDMGGTSFDVSALRDHRDRHAEVERSTTTCLESLRSTSVQLARGAVRSRTSTREDCCMSARGARGLDLGPAVTHRQRCDGHRRQCGARDYRSRLLSGRPHQVGPQYRGTYVDRIAEQRAGVGREGAAHAITPPATTTWSPR